MTITEVLAVVILLRPVSNCQHQHYQAETESATGVRECVQAGPRSQYDCSKVQNETLNKEMKSGPVAVQSALDRTMTSCDYCITGILTL